MEDNIKPPPPEPEPGGDGAKSSVPRTDATCWICLDGGDLQRSCACRGPSAGYAHIDCIARYAESKLEEVLTSHDDSNEVDARRLHVGCKFESILAPYRSCPTCKHSYTGKMVIDLAYAFMDHTENLPATHTLRVTSIFNLAQRYMDAAPGAPDAAEKAEKAKQLFTTVVDCDFIDFKVLSMLGLCLVEVLLANHGGKGEVACRWLAQASAFYFVHREDLEGIGVHQDELGFKQLSMMIKTTWLGANSSSLSSSSKSNRAKQVKAAKQALQDKSTKFHSRGVLQETLIDEHRHGIEFVEALMVCTEWVAEAERTLGPEHEETVRRVKKTENIKDTYRRFLVYVRDTDNE